MSIPSSPIESTVSPFLCRFSEHQINSMAPIFCSLAPINPRKFWKRPFCVFVSSSDSCQGFISCPILQIWSQRAFYHRQLRIFIQISTLIFRHLFPDLIQFNLFQQQNLSHIPKAKKVESFLFLQSTDFLTQIFSFMQEKVLSESAPIYRTKYRPRATEKYFKCHLQPDKKLIKSTNCPPIVVPKKTVPTSANPWSI